MDTFDDHQTLQAVLAATRALLTLTAPEQVPGIVATLVHDLGGGLVPARIADAAAMPLDVSLGLGEPMLPRADPVSVAAMRMAAVLPQFIDDAWFAVHRLRGETRRAEEADTDALTGMLSRRAWMRRLSNANQGDTLCLIDLDDFKGVNDQAGHAVGDQVLASVGTLLLRMLRGVDSCGRYGGDEIACLTAMSVDALTARIEDARTMWRQVRPRAAAQVGLSVGIAAIGELGGRAALLAADRALYRAKKQGRDRTAIASEQDYPQAQGHDVAT